MRHLLTFSIQREQDVVCARQRAAQIAALLGFDLSQQTRIAIGVSEIVRNAFRYAEGATVAFAIECDRRPQRFVTRVSDRGPGIPHLEGALSGSYVSPTGMGLGIAGARRLTDHFTIETSPGGTLVTIEQDLPSRAPPVTAERLAQIADAIDTRQPIGLVEEIEPQNQALLRALDDVQRKQEKLERFLSNMTHEFRTPVNAIIGLCNLLLEDRQRELREPEPELHHIRQAADQLSDLVNDLLDLAKVEAGKTVVRPSRFVVAHLFGALRGMLRPLRLNQSVALVFEDVSALPDLHTDEARVSQILRNLLSNALKFTERGEVRVSAGAGDHAGTVVFTVSDTGIGIDPADQRRIFDEFTRLEHRLQVGARGTGLGLALSRRLAELLGGSLTVESEPGVGSTFRLTIPVRYTAPDAEPLAPR